MDLRRRRLPLDGRHTVVERRVLGSSITPPGSTEQYGATARVAGQVISGPGYSLHLGADAEWLIQPPRNLVSVPQSQRHGVTVLPCGNVNPHQQIWPQRTNLWRNSARVRRHFDTANC